MEILAQVIGIVASVVTIFSFQCKKTKHLFFLQLIGGGLFALHFIFLDAKTGFIQNCMAMLRCFILYNAGAKWAQSKFILPVLTAMFILCGIITYSGWLSLLPTAAMVVSTIAMWTKKGEIIRIVQLCAASPLWLIYNFSAASVAGVITELFNIASVISSMVRLKGKME